MGNVQSCEVILSAKNKIKTSESSKLYSFINVKQQGNLLKLIREVFSNKKYLSVNEKVRKILSRFSSKDVEGKITFISQLIRMKVLEFSMSKRLAPVNQVKCKDSSQGYNNKNNYSKHSYLTRFLTFFCCLPTCHSKYNLKVASINQYVDVIKKQPKSIHYFFKLQQRDTFDETILQLRLLVTTIDRIKSTQSRIVCLFHKFVNRIDKDDDEEPLCATIYDENDSTVTFIINHEADVIQKAINNFSCLNFHQNIIHPIERELPILTNYKSHGCLNGYSIPFTAYLQLDDSYRATFTVHVSLITKSIYLKINCVHNENDANKLIASSVEQVASTAINCYNLRQNDTQIHNSAQLIKSSNTSMYKLSFELDEKQSSSKMFLQTLSKVLGKIIISFSCILIFTLLTSGQIYDLRIEDQLILLTII